MTSGWTAERDARLRQFWAEGLSASQVAARLGGVTRSAVCGRVHRLNLPPRITATRKRWEHKRKPKPKLKKAKPISFPRPPQIKPAPPPAAGAWDPLPGSTPIPLEYLAASHCRWPIGETAPHTFCGCEKAPGLAYCATHAAWSIEAPTVRRKAVQLPALETV